MKKIKNLDLSSEQTNPVYMNRFQTGCLILLSLIAGTSALMSVRSVLIPFILSFFIYSVFRPPLRWLEFKLRLPRILSVVVLTFFVFCFGFFVFILISQAFEIIVQEQDLFRKKFELLLSSVQTKLKAWNLDLASSELQSMVSQTQVLGFLRKLTGGVVGVLTNLGLILIFFAFFLMGAQSSVKAKKAKKKSLLEEIEKNISTYISIKFVISLLTGLFIGLILLALDVKLAVFFGLLAFLLNFIPTLGSLIATILPLPIIWLYHGFSFHFYIFLILALVLQILLGNFVEPKLLGKSMDIHPIVVLLSLLFWGFVLGGAGVFLAVPLTVSLKLALSHLEPTKTLSEALAGRL